jgi:SMI1 / KNR4 family (SUKH-1)
MWEFIRLRVPLSGGPDEGAVDSDIASAELNAGVVLPPDYSAFCREIGWVESPLLTVYGVSASCPRHLRADLITNSERTLGHPPISASMFVVSNDGAGNLTCLDLANDAASGVVFLIHDDPSTVERWPTFGDWLGSMLDEYYPAG